MNYSQPDLAGLTGAMTRTMNLVRQTWQQHAPLPGLDESHLELLFALDEGPRRITRLATDLGSDLSTLSRRISRMTGLGLVEKQAVPGDRRVLEARLTPAGEEALHAVMERRREMVEGILGSWPAEDLASLRILLDRMNEQVSAHCLP